MARLPVRWPSILSCARRLDELRATLPADTLANLVEKCLADLSDRLVSLRDASVRSDHEGLKTAAHAMAGMAAEYGMASLEARLRALMQTACQEPTALRHASMSGGRTLPDCRGVARGPWHRVGLTLQPLLIAWRDPGPMLSPLSLAAFSAGMAPASRVRPSAPRALGFGAIVTVRRSADAG